MRTDGPSVASRVQEEHDSLKKTMAAIRSELESGTKEAGFADWKLNFVCAPSPASLTISTVTSRRTVEASPSPFNMLDSVRPDEP